MISEWSHLKETAILLRQSGQSIKTINRNLGIPLSTLSGWFKHVVIVEEHRLRLQKNKEEALVRARLKAVEWHHTQKELRLLKAKREATRTLEQIEITDSVLDLTFAMTYFGEGTKTDLTSIASSDPTTLRFALAVLNRNYGISRQTIRCNLHLRVDQDSDAMKAYWSKELRIPLDCFKYVAVDKRSRGKPTYEYYKGVCVLTCSQVAIQRKLRYLYTLFCEKIAELEMGT